MSIVLAGTGRATFIGRREGANGGGWSCEKEFGVWFGAKLISETRLSCSSKRMAKGVTWMRWSLEVENHEPDTCGC